MVLCYTLYTQYIEESTWPPFFKPGTVYVHTYNTVSSKILTELQSWAMRVIRFPGKSWKSKSCALQVKIWTVTRLSTLCRVTMLVDKVSGPGFSWINEGSFFLSPLQLKRSLKSSYVAFLSILKWQEVSNPCRIMLESGGMWLRCTTYTYTMGWNNFWSLLLLVHLKKTLGSKVHFFYNFQDFPGL